MFVSSTVSKFGCTRIHEMYFVQKARQGNTQKSISLVSSFLPAFFRYCFHYYIYFILFCIRLSLTCLSLSLSLSLAQNVQHLILEHSQHTFLLRSERHGFTPIQNNRQNYTSIYFNLYNFGKQTGRR